MTTEEIHQEKKKLATALIELIWNSPLYKDEHVDIEIGCIKLAPIYAGPKDKIVGVKITATVV